MLWAWIRAERKRRGWTQADLAARAGISAQAVSAGERGDRGDVTSDTLQKLAGALELTTDQLLRLAGVGSERVTVAQLRREGVPEKYLAPLDVLAASLTDADWVMVVSLVRGLADKNTQQGQQGPQGAIRPAEAEHQAEQAPMGTERRNGWEQARGC